VSESTKHCVVCGDIETEHSTASHKFDLNVFPVTYPATKAGNEWIADDFRGNPGKWTTFLTAEGLSQRIQKVEHESRNAVLDTLDAAIHKRREIHRRGALPVDNNYSMEDSMILDMIKAVRNGRHSVPGQKDDGE
jgi:hypothetical protein